MSSRPPWLEPFERDPAELGPLEPVAAEAAEGPAGPRPGRRSRRLAGLAALAGLAGLLLWDAALRIGGLVIEAPLLGLPLAAFTGLFAAGTGAIALREWRELRRLQARAGLREQASRLVGSEFHGAAEALLRRIAEELPADAAATSPVAVVRTIVRPTLSDGEQLELFERQLLVPLDRRAYRLVLESSRDVGVLTALSPAGLFAGVLVLWRTLLLLRAIAALYGMAPGAAASFALFRRCLRNAVLAGVADMATHAALEHMGAGLAALLSARAGQGAGNAVLAARVGLEAIRQTRPLPFVVAKPPSLREVTKSLFD